MGRSPANPTPRAHCGRFANCRCHPWAMGIRVSVVVRQSVGGGGTGDVSKLLGRFVAAILGQPRESERASRYGAPAGVDCPGPFALSIRGTAERVINAA